MKKKYAILWDSERRRSPRPPLYFRLAMTVRQPIHVFAGFIL